MQSNYRCRARESLNKLRTVVDDSTFLAIQMDKVIQAFSNIQNIVI